MKITSMKVDSPKGKITLYRITNDNGASVALSSLGAGIIAVEVPDRYGDIDNVCLGYDEAADYINDGPCMGKVPGRYANRIAGGRLTIGGKEYPLPVNNGPNHLHGGPDGFQNRIWDSTIIPEGVRFTLNSADGEMGYPGNLKATVDYKWDNRNRLSVTLRAETDAPTVVNLTNHAYWNLEGADAGTVLDHELRLKASRWLPTDDTLIPTGEILPVDGTPMDFRRLKTLGSDMKAEFPALRYGKGYDNCWAVDDWTLDPQGKPVMLQNVVELRAPESGRILRVATDQPGVQIYTGNWLADSPLNADGESYEDYDGVAIECQGFPDAPSHPDFPSQLLLPGERYERHIVFSFG